MQCHNKAADYVVDTGRKLATGNYVRRRVLRVEKQFFTWPGLFQAWGLLVVLDIRIEIL